MCHGAFIEQVANRSCWYSTLYPRMIFTKCFKMSVDESQWTHGFDVNWCDNFSLRILQIAISFVPPFFFSTLDIAFATPTDGFLYFLLTH